MDVWDFVFSLNPIHVATEFNKPLASSPKFYIWVIRNFGAGAQITALCFNDLLETRVSLDFPLQTSNVEVPIGMNQWVSQNDVQTDFQIPSIKRSLEAKEIKEIKELWKQKLEDMHYSSIYSRSGLTNSIRNCLHKFVDENYYMQKRSQVKIMICLSK
ncbi:8882_t:CDS:2 [Gigaspora margarita]|uniref:8882_t:CDS:1 n=1 Tax=Gigaspora margarita TaxID=4874 RepID=A0ABN7USN8_GIGMA|nr:8882_t:CDS:2 [Gigaspora margarita]